MEKTTIKNIFKKKKSFSVIKQNMYILFWWQGESFMQAK